METLICSSSQKSPHFTTEKVSNSSSFQRAEEDLLSTTISLLVTKFVPDMMEMKENLMQQFRFIGTIRPDGSDIFRKEVTKRGSSVTTMTKIFELFAGQTETLWWNNICVWINCAQLHIGIVLSASKPSGRSETKKGRTSTSSSPNNLMFSVDFFLDDKTGRNSAERIARNKSMSCDDVISPRKVHHNKNWNDDRDAVFGHKYPAHKTVTFQNRTQSFADKLHVQSILKT